VSKLFDVTENSQLTDMYEHKPIRIPYGKGIVGYVAESGETVNIPDAYQVLNIDLFVRCTCRQGTCDGKGQGL
jgi:hypothetical protein